MRVLLIGPYAPHGQVGAIRVLSISRYLVNTGFEVSVLCLSEDCVREMDKDGMTSQVPEGIDVHTYSVSVHVSGTMKKNSINEKEFREALGGLLAKKTFDAAIVSAGPFYTFRALDELRSRKIPYIVDYRDLNISSADKRKRKGLKNKAKMLLTFPTMYRREKKCLKGAKYVTVVSPEMRDNLADFFRIDKQKIHVAYNGYDDYLLSKRTFQKEIEGSFVLGYFGKLMYYDRNLTLQLFDAIEDLNQNGLEISLLHIGPTNHEINDFFADKGYNRSGWYSCTGQMPYVEGVERLASCHACVLEYAYPEGPGTKVFDYIFLNKPIIGVTKPGIPLESMLKQFDHAYVCHSKQDVISALDEIKRQEIHCLLEGEDAHDKIFAFSRSKQNDVFKQLLLKED